MSINHERLLRILYHPVEYTHASHLPSGWQPVVPESEPLLNYWLHHNYQLSDLPAPLRSGSQQLSLVLQHWYRLPAIAHLVGGYLLRASLPRQGLTLLLDASLLAFITLPLMHQVCFTGMALSRPDTQACGAAFILSQCQHLPQGLYQRFLLHFPATIDLPTLSAPQTSDHLNLLRMAINYANCFPG